MLVQWILIVLYAAGAWISKERCAEAWIVGPVFGAVVLAWHTGFAKIPGLRQALYFVASTLIYALVFTIADSEWSLETEWLEWIVGSLTIGVAIGSVLLPLTHRILLGGGMPVWKIALALIGSFYAVTWTGGILDAVGFPFEFDYYAVAVFVWQGLYLWFFYASRIRKALQLPS